MAVQVIGKTTKATCESKISNSASVIVLFYLDNAPAVSHPAQSSI
jgi:hypothetical protein